MTILDPSLRVAPRTLKLTGMLHTLDARLAQTRDGTLGHLDFLQDEMDEIEELCRATADGVG